MHLRLLPRCLSVAGDAPPKPPKGESGPPGSGLQRPLPLSPALANFLNTGGVPLARSEVVKRIWAYIKEHQLQVSCTTTSPSGHGALLAPLPFCSCASVGGTGGMCAPAARGQVLGRDLARRPWLGPVHQRLRSGERQCCVGPLSMR